jgi:hypothetical protein
LGDSSCSKAFGGCIRFGSVSSPASSRNA